MVSEPPRWFTYAAAGIEASNRRCLPTNPDVQSPTIHVITLTSSAVVTVTGKSSQSTAHPVMSIVTSLIPQRKPINLITKSSRSIPQRNLEDKENPIARTSPAAEEGVRSSHWLKQIEQFSDSATDVVDPQRKEGVRLAIPSRSPVQVIAIAVPQWKLFTQRNYNPEDLENSHRISSLQSEILNLKQREQYSDSATVVVFVDLQKLNERIAKLSGGVAAIQDCPTHELYESNSIPERELYCFSDFHFAVTAALPLLVVVVRDCERNYPRMSSSSSSSSSSKPPRPASSRSNPRTPVSSSSKPPPKLPKEEIIVGGIAKTCWVKFRQEAIFALYTPFIICVASGTLEVETLRQYIAQDVHFLKPFDKAFELAETYAVDDDDRSEVNKLRKITKKEAQLA